MIFNRDSIFGASCIWVPVTERVVGAVFRIEIHGVACSVLVTSQWVQIRSLDIFSPAAAAAIFGPAAACRL